MDKIDEGLILRNYFCCLMRMGHISPLAGPHRRLILLYFSCLLCYSSILLASLCLTFCSVLTKLVQCRTLYTPSIDVFGDIAQHVLQVLYRPSIHIAACATRKSNCPFRLWDCLASVIVMDGGVQTTGHTCVRAVIDCQHRYMCRHASNGNGEGITNFYAFEFLLY